MYNIFAIPKSIKSLLENNDAQSRLKDLKEKIDKREKISPDLFRDLPSHITDLEYIRHVILTSLFLVRLNQGARLTLPLLDDEKLSKQNALPYQFWGLLYENWQPEPEEGTTVFLTGYQNRGPDNRKKRIYYSALTPDLYPFNYQKKVVGYFDNLLSETNVGQPLMSKYLDSYFNLYWDLHLGVTGDDIPDYVTKIGTSFNTVLAYVDPLQEITYENYMNVRQIRPELEKWIAQKVNDIAEDNISDSDKTFVYYWLENSNGGKSPYFKRDDIIFECFHNFVAFSQWGNTIYNIMSLLSTNAGNPVVKSWFEKTMSGDYDEANGEPFTPLDRFVMELFRTISPNSGSISKVEEVREPIYDRYNYYVTPHKETSEYYVNWKKPTIFNPDRYIEVPTSNEVNAEKCEEIGFAQCPFHKTGFLAKDGRDTNITNSTFGTVYNVTDDQTFPVADYAGYAPFGFGYRRCPGELFTIDVIKDFLRKVWNDGIQFEKLDIADPKNVPVGPATVVPDVFGFTYR
ncbi:hypothetical protein [Okeania sp. KiyG1]|uniref:hypothetical protein n=1 Tax=Okeania sp. KiyG1 TaxID=2720165 RepID=UPI001924E9AA|nr:hypothetical protein [Okeania sp. KiyG1]